MEDLINELVPVVLDELCITSPDERTGLRIEGYIKRGMHRLQEIAGGALDFQQEAEPRRLLLDYCRYANSQALEVFEKNFQSDLLGLNLKMQVDKNENKNTSTI